MFHWNQRCAAGFLALSFLCAALSACAKHPVKPSQNGVGRTQITANNADAAESSDESGATTPSDTAAADQTTTTDTTVGGEPSYRIENGKYVYTIPAPDRSGLSDLSDVNSLSSALFSYSGNAT